MFHDISIHKVQSHSVWGNLAWKKMGGALLPIGLLSISASLLTGCAIPLPVQAASWAIDAVSYMVSNKSLLDHGISQASGRDCAVFRIVTEGAPCRDIVPVAVANIEVSETVANIEVSELPPLMDPALIDLEPDPKVTE